MPDKAITHIDPPSRDSVPPKFVPSLKNRILGLDELRGVAILLVLLDHSIFLWQSWGSQLDFLGTLGVNIFFIISGYLIYTILNKERSSSHFFRTFYVRRIFRIWPLFLAITILGLLVALHAHQSVKNALPYYLTFTMNFAIDRGEGWILPFTSPMWSLAIEEQFYLFLPLLVFVLNPKRLPVVIAFLCAASALSSLLFLHWTSDGNAAFFYPNFHNTALRFHYIGFGVLLAARPPLAYWIISAWLAASLLCFHFAGIMEITLAFLIVWVVDRTIRKGPLFRNRFLAWSGFLCYGLYLIHWPIARTMEITLLPRLKNSEFKIWLMFAFFVGLSFLGAFLSFHFFENPVQKLRTRFEKPAPRPPNQAVLS